MNIPIFSFGEDTFYPVGNKKFLLNFSQISVNLVWLEYNKCIMMSLYQLTFFKFPENQGIWKAKPLHRLWMQSWFSLIVSNIGDFSKVTDGTKRPVWKR